nr:MAG TPA: hypothetical protein [Caudoviricetes sp.]
MKITEIFKYFWLIPTPRGFRFQINIPLGKRKQNKENGRRKSNT